MRYASVSVYNAVPLRLSILSFIAPMLLGILSGPNLWADRFSREIRQIQTVLDQGNYDRALELSRELETNHPDHPLPVYCAGMASFLKGKKQESVEAFEEAAASYAEAARFFRQAATLASDDEARDECIFAAVSALVRRGIALGNLEKFGEAADTIRSAMPLFEQSGDNARFEKTRDFAAIKLREYLAKLNEQEDEKQKNEKNDSKDSQNVGMILEALTELPRKEVVVQENAAILQEKDTPDGPRE
ncbi:MAG TPA: hypothetical protein PLX03_05455 [Candidatus Hydrogenedentes bacterium]|nr:hypothetical protein [Candidatus Hydrogenedentota bacterium]